MESFVDNQEVLKKVREILKQQTEIVTGSGTNGEKADALDQLIQQVETDKDIANNPILGPMKHQRDQFKGSL